MGDDLFEGLPPPSSTTQHQREQQQQQQKQKQKQPEPQQPIVSVATNNTESSAVPAPKPILKSALKRPNPTQPDAQATAPKKSLKFKTTTEASEAQVIEAMQKISSHIKNPAKFSKAAKLAIQLIEAGSVKSDVIDYFFAILEAAMSSSTPCTDPSVRADYHSLFSAAQNTKEHLNMKQKNQLATWTISAVVANDLYTDDSFVAMRSILE